MAYELNRAFDETDLRDVYAAVRVPTMVLYRESPLALEESLAVAAAIPGARGMRVSGTDYWGLFLSAEIPEELERFVAGEPGPEVPASVLTTLLFTDIVGSTGRAAELGDRGWRDLLAGHNALAPSTRASASCTRARSQVSPWRSVLASARPRTRARCSSRGR
jgi:hypothetical protein